MTISASHAVPGDSSTLPTPWRSDEILRWLGMLSVGAAMIAVGWWMAAGQGHFTDQAGGATLAVAGAIVATTAHVVWITRGRRAVGERMWAALDPAWLDDRRVATKVIEVGAVPTVVAVVCADLVLFHQPPCPMLAGRDWRYEKRVGQERSGRRACGLCAKD